MTVYDLLVVGGGVQGLWLARCAIAAGLKVALVEAESCGSGASGGLLGALMPHVPTGWSEKKRFQFEALIALERHARTLESETGIDTGYTRCGRIMPVRQTGFLDQFPSRRAASWLHWRTHDGRYELDLLDGATMPGWLDPNAAPLGIFWDPLAARINPASYIAALTASLRPNCTIFEGWRFAGYDTSTGQAVADNGRETITAAQIVLAAGYETYPLAEHLTGLKLGSGVKGQAVLLAAPMPAERPIIFDDGMYIVAHSSEHCAVGSTTETDWTDAHTPDDALDDKLSQARLLCPALRDAPIVAAWAGVRPQSAARDPIAGRLLPGEPVYIATGGFKITLGIAHAVAASLIDAIVSGHPPTGLPATFEPSLHVAKARGKSAAADQLQ